jgi:tetratricopeptide (TPR) repeat protein
MWCRIALSAWACAVLVVLCASATLGATINVPGDYPTIQAAIYYDLGAVEQAEAVEQGLQPPERDASTNWAAALRRRAQMQYRAGQYEEAIRLLTQAQQVDDTLQRKLALVDDLNGLAACYLALARQRAQP